MPTVTRIWNGFTTMIAQWSSIPHGCTVWLHEKTIDTKPNKLSTTYLTLFSVHFNWNTQVRHHYVKFTFTRRCALSVQFRVGGGTCFEFFLIKFQRSTTRQKLRENPAKFRVEPCGSNYKEAENFTRRQWNAGRSRVIRQRVHDLDKEGRLSTHRIAVGVFSPITLLTFRGGGKMIVVSLSAHVSAPQRNILGPFIFRATLTI